MPITILLYRPEHPGNLGSIARLAANFGFSDIRLIEPQCGITEESRNLAKHAQHVLDGMKTEKASILKKFDLLVMTHGRECESYNMVRSPTTPRQLKERLDEIDSTRQRVGILFGPESEGLSPDLLRTADIVVSIPTIQEYSSMNLAMSVGIILYELSQHDTRGKITAPFVPMGKKEHDVLLKLVDECLDKSSFPHEKRKDTVRMAMRRMISRAFLTKREAFAIMGFLKRYQGKR